MTSKYSGMTNLQGAIMAMADVKKNPLTNMQGAQRAVSTTNRNNRSSKRGSAGYGWYRGTAPMTAQESMKRYEEMKNRWRPGPEIRPSLRYNPYGNGPNSY